MRIAVTGGIGSGKSTVISFFGARGFKTASADEINAELLADKNYIGKLQKLFPSAVKDGLVDKAKLKETIFLDNKSLQKINKLAHTEIAKKINKIKGNLVIEVPLLVESKMWEMFDKIIAVTAPIEVRVKRIISRDGISEELAKKIIAAQASDSERNAIADFVIDTDCSMVEITEKIDAIIAKL